MKKSLLFSALMVCGGVAFAEDSGEMHSGGEAVQGKMLPGNTVLPSSDEALAKIAQLAKSDAPYQVADFFTLPEVSSYQISPDGKYLSWRKRNAQGKRDIWLRDIKTGEERLFITEGEDVIRAYGWVNEDHLVFMQDNGGDENYHIYAIGLDEQAPRDLTPFENVRATIINGLKEDKARIIIQMNKEDAQLFEPYLLNVVSGEMEKLYDNPQSEEPIEGFLFDKRGDLRMLTRIVNGQDADFYYKIDGEFKKIKHVPFGETFDVLAFDERSDNPDDAYVVSSEDSDKSRIYRYDLKENKVIEEIFRDEVYDMGSVSLSRKRNYELDAIFYNGAKPQIIIKSETFAGWMKDLENQLGSENKITIVDRDDDERQMIVVVASDKEPGSYYLYDSETKKLTQLTQLFSHLKREDMSEMMPIEFESRDGLTLHGYFSRPVQAKEEEKVPVVVYVHGGPQGVRDSWGFDPQVQLFTSHGYGVLQVNFRISGGYGKEFFNSGLGEVGRKTMDDVEDGVAYIIEQGWADPERIAIYGASHGGFAVLRGLIKTPDLYACGVDYVGVSNLFTFMNSIPPYWESARKMLYTIWYDPTDEKQQAIMNEVSPLQNADKITKPLFVVQGANDPRVNINEADQIVENLRARGVEVPYMVKYDEGHGFAKEANRLEMQQTMMGFLHQCLAPQADKKS
ncbi:S9 family peptidase [Rappaport israeli]|uniref:S9 family peptidase n=1 Tax=Rappaport israeli TaxID=1839807 RepID=UPI000930893C|nr:S9 family peptidase [Rappaport israeli]